MPPDISTLTIADFNEAVARGEIMELSALATRFGTTRQALRRAVREKRLQAHTVGKRTYAWLTDAETYIKHRRDADKLQGP